MIKYIIIGIVVLVVWFMFKNRIKNAIIYYVQKRKELKAEPLPKVSKEFIYTPIISSRTFQFAIEITEVGDGKAIISVVKAR